jgi:hypothetical protein
MKTMVMNKQGLVSDLAKWLLLLLFLIVLGIWLALRFIPGFGDPITKILSSGPEIDATQQTNNFFENQDNQISYFRGIDAALQKAAAFKDKGFCFVELPPMDQEGFYEADAGPFSIYIEQETQGDKTGISLRLTQDRKQGFETSAKAVETPVTASFIEGNIKPCLIMGSATVNNFYKQFNDIEKDNLPDISGIAPTDEYSLLISPSALKAYMGYRADNSLAAYKTVFLFKSKENTAVYVIKINDANGEHVCFIPLAKSGIGGCSSPGSKEYVDEDCLDSTGKNTIKTNFESGLLDKKYLCSGASNQENRKCACGGDAVSGSFCEVESNQAQCECLSAIAQKKYAEEHPSGKPAYTQIMNYNPITKACRYSEMDCEYVQAAKETNYAQLETDAGAKCVNGASNECACGGTRIGAGQCLVAKTEAECKCMEFVANAKYKELTGKDSAGYIKPTNPAGSCTYNVLGCEYYQKAQATNYDALAAGAPDNACGKAPVAAK